MWEFGGRAIGFKEGLMNETSKTQMEIKKMIASVAK